MVVRGPHARRAGLSGSSGPRCGPRGRCSGWPSERPSPARSSRRGERTCPSPTCRRAIAFGCARSSPFCTCSSRSRAWLSGEAWPHVVRRRGVPALVTPRARRWRRGASIGARRPSASPPSSRGSASRGKPVVRGGTGTDGLELRQGWLAAARLLAGTEEHGRGRQLTRFRVWPRWSRFASRRVLGHRRVGGRRPPPPMPGSTRACSRPARSGSSCAPSRLRRRPRNSSTKRSTSSRPTVKPGCVEDASPLLPYLRTHPREIAIMLGAMVAGVAVDLLRPWPMKLLIDHVLGGQPLPPGFAALVAALPGGQSAKRAARVGQRRHHRDLPGGLHARHGVAGDLRAAGTTHGLRARRRPVRARSAAVRSRSTAAAPSVTQSRASLATILPADARPMGPRYRWRSRS